MAKPTDTAWLEGIEKKASISQGGPLAEYVQFLQAAGKPAYLAEDGSHAWVPGGPGGMLRFPLHCTSVPDKTEVAELLALKNVRVISHFLEPNQTQIANCFHYMARDPQYCIDSLSSNTRSKVRRGLRNFEVRLATWDEVIQQGFPAMLDTNERHGYSEPEKKQMVQYAEALRHSPFHQVWGAWDEEGLAAWATWLRIDDYAVSGAAYSRTASLRKYPNNALIYATTHHFLKGQNCTYVSYGISSVQAHSDTLVSLHKFKRQMGYDAVPMHRHFIPAPLLRPLLRWRCSSWLLESAARLAPQISSLRKAAGISRLLSGREKDPLSWAQDLD